MRAGGGWAAGLLAWVAQPSRADLCSNASLVNGFLPYWRFSH